VAGARRAAAAEQVASKKRLSQEDVPGCSLEFALRVPRAIADNYAGNPVTALQLAAALNMSPSSGPFRSLCGASIAYGLTEGGYNAQQIILKPLGKRIVRPLEEGDDLNAKREAVLKPRVIGEFLNKYAGSPLPRHDIALNVLHTMGVPAEKAESVFKMIVDSAESVGFLREIKGKKYVELSGVSMTSLSIPTIDDDPEEELAASEPSATIVQQPASSVSSSTPDESRLRRVFITHGRNAAFVEPIKKLLAFGELEPVVSVDKQSVSQPVPDKVMNDMRSCGAAIIHVEDETRLIDKDAAEHVVLNPNVLIEIGAAMALYGRRFVLLVRDGVKLPSNLQGLYEVRYIGDQMDSAATIKLLEAIRDIKNHATPHFGPSK
jgi:predicted nucleotide-binding protein